MDGWRYFVTSSEPASGPRMSNLPLPSPADIGWIALDAVLALAAVLLIVRVIGLRSFAKMSSFDFAVTIACGSILGAVILNRDASFLHGLFAIGFLLSVQWVIARGRRTSDAVGDMIDNQPLLLMRRGKMIEANMALGRITEADLRAKLREANVTEPSKALAVVLETTGDVSVLHGDGPLDETLLKGVRS